MPSISEILHSGALLLPGDEARREAALLLRHVLGVSDAWLVAHPDGAVDAAHAAAFQRLIERRARGEPVAYLTGARGFLAIELRVTPGVLIPRAETEVLVDLALQCIPVDVDCRVADLGTGSGAIALAIAHARTQAQVVATDISEAALEVARGNAERLRIGNVEFRQGDWYAGLGDERFDVIVSNPPYIAEGDPPLREGDLRFEPTVALASGADGLDAIRFIARIVPLVALDVRRERHPPDARQPHQRGFSRIHFNPVFPAFAGRENFRATLRRDRKSVV